MNKKLQIRVRAIPARFVIDQSPQKASKKSLFELLRDWIGLLVTAAGIFSVLLYLAGRSFASGYFSAMNIPSYQVNFSLWEYEEAGWIPLLLYPIMMVIITSVLIGILYVLFEWVLSPLLRRFVGWVKQKIQFRFPKWKFPTIGEGAKSWFAVTRYSLSIIWFMAALFLTLLVTGKVGETDGQSNVLDHSAQVELVSNNIIPLDDVSNISPTVSADGVYIYKGFHLLTSNDGKYYLFREIDQATCKPSKVFIVEASDNIHVNLLAPVSLRSSQCPKVKKTTVQYP